MQQKRDYFIARMKETKFGVMHSGGSYFICATYGLFGVFATIALAVNVTLLMALLTMLGATLTLPGIAGMVLTMGMAVDANVLIYERVREEVRAGRSAISSLDAGFTRALATIGEMTDALGSRPFGEPGPFDMRRLD